MSNFLNDLPGEVSDPTPSCSYCADSGTVFPNWVDMDNTGELEWCECDHGDRAMLNDDEGRFLDAEEPYEPDDWADGDALASAGMGTDEDYGCYDSGDEW